MRVVRQDRLGGLACKYARSHEMTRFRLRAVGRAVPVRAAVRRTGAGCPGGTHRIFLRTVSWWLTRRLAVLDELVQDRVAAQPVGRHAERLLGHLRRLTCPQFLGDSLVGRPLVWWDSASGQPP